MGGDGVDVAACERTESENVLKAPIALRALPQQVGEGRVSYLSPNLLGEYPEGGGGA